MRLVPRIKRSCCCCPIVSAASILRLHSPLFPPARSFNRFLYVYAHVLCLLCASHFLVMLLVRWARFLPHFLGNFGGSCIGGRKGRAESILFSLSSHDFLCVVSRRILIMDTSLWPCHNCVCSHSCLSRDGLHVDAKFLFQRRCRPDYNTRRNLVSAWIKNDHTYI